MNLVLTGTLYNKKLETLESTVKENDRDGEGKSESSTEKRRELLNTTEISGRPSDMVQISLLLIQ